MRKGGETTKPLPKGKLTLKETKALKGRERTYRLKNLWMSNLYIVTETLNVMLLAGWKEQERKILSSVYSTTQMLYRIIPMETLHLKNMEVIETPRILKKNHQLRSENPRWKRNAT